MKRERSGEEEEGGGKGGVEREGEEEKGGGKGRRGRGVHIPPLGFLLGNFFLFLSFFPVQGSRFSSIQP